MNRSLTIDLGYDRSGESVSLQGGRKESVFSS